LSTGPYARAKRTADGGYYSKLMQAAYQYIKVGPPNSDCGTNRTIQVSLTKDNIELWMYSYIKEGSRLIELTSDNMDKYIGKTVNMRFSSLCESENYICNKCAGNLFNRLGITNIGMSVNQIAERLKNKLLKLAHSTEIKTVEIDVDEAFNIK
jgi:hypothetical protein